MAQRDEHPDIQAFLDWVQKNSKYAVLDPNSEERRAFMPLQTVEEYFKEDGSARLNELLAAVFDSRDPPVGPDEILENYAQTFCILVEIGKGRFVERFSSWGLGDRMLPFDPDHAPPSHFPTDTTDPGFYQKFCNKQWKFCVPEFKSPMTNIRFHPERILPIVSKEEIARGGSAVLYKIKVHNSYNWLNSPSTDPGRPSTNTYTLKVYLTPEAKKYFENEVAAFRRLKRLTNSGVIGFHGCYIQAHAFNVILEYADKGNLEEYFATRIPPRRRDEILDFWTGMFRALWALKCIHDVDGKSHSEGPQLLHGFHQDIKPANILVASNKRPSPYKWDFKVADLGLSHFKRVVDEAGNATANDSHGTRCYGAPECYRSDHFLEQANLRVKQDVDIWSLGGIFSEAAVWIAHGYQGVLDYRISRKEETDRLMGFKDGDCFHNGERVLRAVGKWHRDISGILPKNDEITTLVLSMVENEMLVESDARSTAKQLWYRSQQNLERAKQDAQLPNELTSNGFDTPETSPRQPPEMPPSPNPPSRTTDTRRISSRQDPRQVSWSETTNGPNLYNMSRRDPSPDRESEFNDESPSPVERKGAHGGTDHWRGSTRESQTEYPGRRQTSNSSGPSGHTSNVPYRRKRSSEQSRTDHRTRASYSSGGSEHNTHPKGSPKAYVEDDGSYHEPRGNGEGSSVGRSRSRRGPTERHGMRQFLPNLSEGSGDSYFPGDRNAPARAENPGSGYNQPPGDLPNVKADPTEDEPEQEIPYLSVVAASRWRTQMQSRKSIGFGSSKIYIGNPPDPLPHQYLQTRLKERDHIFLIDDAASMEPYWQEVIGLVNILAYIVKVADPDGIELFYTISQKSIKSKDSSVLVKSVQKTKPHGITDIAMGLNAILGQYNTTLQRTFGSSTVAATALEDIRPLSLYVLTDGLWQPHSDAEGPIKNIVKTLLRQSKLVKKQVGIQFIQFGNNQGGKAKLASLDDDLTIKESRGQLDIVDTEHSSGNVWKMLLGAIDPWFDRGGPAPGAAPSSAN